MGIRRSKMEEEQKNIPAQSGEAKAEEVKKTAEKTAQPEPKKEKKGKKNPFKNKKFRYGSLSVVFTVIFVAAIVLVNVICNLLLDRFDVKADLTDGGIYSLSEELSEFAKNSDSTVNFYFTSTEETLTGAGSVYKQSVEFVKNLTNLNKKYSVQYVDLLTNPSFSEKYGANSEGELIVECEETERYKVFNIGSDFLRYVLQDGNSYDTSTAQMMVMYGYQVTDQTSIAEQELLSAIMSVTKINPIKVAFATGFGETENSALISLLEKNAYIVDTLDVDTAAEIPAEYEILVINGPTMDYSDEVLDKLDAWLSNNGLFGKNLMYFASVNNPTSTPKIDAFLKEWGISVDMGYSLQLDGNYAYSVQGMGTPFYQRAELITDTDFYKAAQIGANTSFRVNGFRPVRMLWEENSNYTNTALIRSYGENSVIMPFDATSETWSEDTAERGQFNVLVEASKVRYEGTTPTYSRVIVGGSELLFDEYFITATNYNNGDAAIALFNAACGNTDQSVTITPKSFTATTYEIDKSQQFGIGITFAVIIPIIIIIAGIVIWVRRRHL